MVYSQCFSIVTVYWFTMVFGGSQSLLVASYEWFSVVLDGSQCLPVVLNVSQWLSVALSVVLSGS